MFGTICITPTAPTFETSELLKPLSCQPIASASAGGTPSALAIEAISEELTSSLVGNGGPPLPVVVGTVRADDVPELVETICVPPPDPPGSVNVVPASRKFLRLMPFAAANWSTVVPACAAIPDNVSPWPDDIATAPPPPPVDVDTISVVPPPDPLDPPGSVNVVPASKKFLRLMPFVAANWSTVVPACAAIPDSVSPGLTT